MIMVRGHVRRQVIGDAFIFLEHVPNGRAGYVHLLNPDNGAIRPIDSRREHNFPSFNGCRDAHKFMMPPNESKGKSGGIFGTGAILDLDRRVNLGLPRVNRLSSFPAGSHRVALGNFDPMLPCG
jgi:hypothetical protein